MKRAFASVAFVVALSACKLLSFEIEEQGGTVVEGAGVLGGLLGDLDLREFDDFDVTLDQALQDQDVQPGDLKSVILTDVVLTGDPDLGFLSGMVIEISATGLAPVVVATLGDVPPGTTEIALEVTGEDFSPAVVAGGLVFSVDASGDVPRDDTAVDVAVVVEVVATPQGACNAAN